ncbi:MAG: glycosyltransferase, partial [Verrucomicrobiaceae bacterium]
MKIAVVTPYYRETAEQLTRCHQSIKDQTVKTDHFFVSDGFPNPIVDTWDCVHIKVPNHADYGDTPRLIGAASAASLRYDAILLLDADNWFEPDHVQTLLDVQAREQADVVTCSRMLIRSDLTRMGECIESDGKRFNDTNCYLVMKHAFPLFRAWGFKDPSLGVRSRTPTRLPPGRPTRAWKGHLVRPGCGSGWRRT